MERALAEARKAAEAGEVPVGAVVARRDGEILAAAHNRVEAGKDPTAHAELLAIQAATQALGEKQLDGCVLVVTLEPCAMCAQAISLARIDPLDPSSEIRVVQPAIVPIGPSQPVVPLAPPDEAFVLAPVGVALRLGRHFGALGGARVGPYEFPARLRSSSPDSGFVFVVILHTEALVLDAGGRALGEPGELEPHPEAASIRETLLSFEVRPATAEEREMFRQLSE